MTNTDTKCNFPSTVTYRVWHWEE